MISGGFQLGNRKVAGADFGLDWPGLRCGAHARTTGQPCKAPAVTGKQRCRMHGGAKGSGGPRGEANGNYRTGGAIHQGNARRSHDLASFEHGGGADLAALEAIYR